MSSPIFTRGAFNKAWQVLAAAAREHRPLLSLMFLLASGRMLGVLFLRPGGFFNLYLADTYHYWNQARWQAADAYPYFDYWLEYPPIFPWLTILAYRIGLLMPPWQDSVAWFTTAYHALLVPFDLGCMALIYSLSGRLGGRLLGYEAATRYAIAFVPLFVFLGYFDSLPLFFTLLGLYALLRLWSGRAGVAIGLGVMSKLFAIILLPAAWATLRTRRARARMALAAAGTVAALGLPGLLVNPEMTVASLRAMTTRASYETVWAILEGYHSFGLVSYERFDAASAGWQVHASTLPSGWITLCFAILFLWFNRAWLRAGQPNLRRLIAFVGVTLTWLMLWSQGFSPQWMIFQIPFVLLLMPGWRGLAYLVVIDLVTMIEWVVAYSWMRPYTWFIDGQVALRTMLILGLGAEFLRIALNARQKWRHRLQWSSRTALVVACVGQIALLARGVRVAAQDHALNEPHAPLVASIIERAGGDTGILIPQVAIFQRLYPLLDGVDSFWPANETAAEDSWQSSRLVRFIESHPDLWLVNDTGGPEPERGHAIERWLSRRYAQVSVAWIGSAQVTRFVTRCPAEVSVQRAVFGSNIRLVAAGVTASATGLCVRLDWQSQKRPDEDYTVFVHVLDESGQLVAQNDQQPVAGLAPMSQWAENSTVVDLHGVILPEMRPADRFQIHIGIYGSDLERLPVLDGAGRSAGTTLYLAQLHAMAGGWEPQMLP